MSTRLCRACMGDVTAWHVIDSRPLDGVVDMTCESCNEPTEVAIHLVELRLNLPAHGEVTRDGVLEALMAAVAAVLPGVNEHFASEVR